MIFFQWHYQQAGSVRSANESQDYQWSMNSYFARATYDIAENISLLQQAGTMVLQNLVRIISMHSSLLLVQHGVYLKKIL